LDDIIFHLLGSQRKIEISIISMKQQQARHGVNTKTRKQKNGLPDVRIRQADQGNQ
jgi:hypothetical protein